MQSESQQPLNDAMLGKFKETDTEVSVYLANGIKLSGKIIAFDRDTLVLTSDAGPEGVGITRANIATMTRRSDEQRNRQEGGTRAPAPVRRPQR